MMVRLSWTTDPETLLAAKERITCAEEAIRVQLYVIGQRDLFLSFYGCGPDGRTYSVPELAEAYQISEDLVIWSLANSLSAVRRFVRQRDV